MKGDCRLAATSMLEVSFVVDIVVTWMNAVCAIPTWLKRGNLYADPFEESQSAFLSSVWT